MEYRKEKAIFIESFKTKRLDGHAVKTVYAMTKTGVVNIERRIVSTELNEGFKEIRRFGKYIFQVESMVFKLESFISISNTVHQNVHKLNMDKIVRLEDIEYEPNEKGTVHLYTDLT